MTRQKQRDDKRKAVSLRDEQRRALHRAIDQICDAIPHAKLDARNPGLPEIGNEGQLGIGKREPGATLRANIANVWLAKIGELERGLYHQADLALKHWTPPPPGATVDGVTIGTIDKTNVCVKCGVPAEKVHRVDGSALCADTCYHQAWRQSKAENISLSAIVKRLRTNADKRPGQTA